MNQPTDNAWSLQVKSVLQSPYALLKLVGVAIVWKLLGLILGLIFNIGIFIIFVVIYYAILWLFPYWQPAFTIVHRIVGDDNISLTLEPFQLKWYQFISPFIRLAFLAYLFYIGITLLIK